jgi:hypothetical protein
VTPTESDGAGDDVAQPLLVAGEQRQVGTLGYQPNGDRASDAGAGPGHDDVLAGETRQ